MSDRLDSWKEIAAYLGRGVRTVQRWEKTEALPVHRHMHDKLGTVYAFRPELDEWWAARRALLEADVPQQPLPETPPGPITALPAQASFQPQTPSTSRYVIGASAILVVALALFWHNSVKARVVEPFRITPFTSMRGYEHAPVFSPDGKRVAFAWKNPDAENVDIFVKTLGREEPVRFTEAPQFEFGACWSPDGNQIAFLRAEPDVKPEVFIKPAAGGAERKVATVHFGAYPSPVLRWSKDPRWMFIAQRPDESRPAAIYRLSVESGETVQITKPGPDVLGDSAITLSPDGLQLAFVRVRQSTERDIFVLRLNSEMLGSGPERKLTQTDGLIGAVAWLPSNQILFATFRDYYSTWWEISPNGGSPREREDLASVQPGIAISPDGKSAIATQYSQDQNIWKIDLSTGEQSPIITSTRLDTNPQISPDGRYIAFPSDRAGNVDIWRSDSNGGNPIVLASFPKKSSGTPRWSPDSSYIAFDVTGENDSDIWIANADGGGKRQLTFGPKRDFIPSWSRNGKYLYFGSLRSGRPEVWKVPVSGGEPVQVTRNVAYGGWESSDGNSLYFTKEIYKGVIEKGLFRLDLATGRESRAIDGYVNWSLFYPTPDGVYYITRADEHSSAIHLLKPNGAMDELVILKKHAMMGFSVSPDRKWAVYTAVDQDEQDLVFIANFR